MNYSYFTLFRINHVRVFINFYIFSTGKQYKIVDVYCYTVKYNLTSTVGA